MTKIIKTFGKPVIYAIHQLHEPTLDCIFFIGNKTSSSNSDVELIHLTPFHCKQLHIICKGVETLEVQPAGVELLIHVCIFFHPADISPVQCGTGTDKAVG